MGLNYATLLLTGSQLKENIRIESGSFKAICFGRPKIFLSAAQERALKKHFEGHTSPLNSVTNGVWGDDFLHQTFGGDMQLDHLDISDFEGANIRANLNQLPQDNFSSNTLGKYDLVLDYGTAEHVFNVANSMSNAFHLLRKDGYYNCVIPVFGNKGHGLYQFSPEFFYAMDSDDFRLVQLVFFEFRENSSKFNCWDGLSSDFYQHKRGTFDGGFGSGLLEDLNQPIYGWAVWQKRTEDPVFSRETIQRVYSNKDKYLQNSNENWVSSLYKYLSKVVFFKYLFVYFWLSVKTVNLKDLAWKY